MYREEVKELFEEYKKSLDSKDSEKALEQNKVLWSEIFNVYNNVNGDNEEDREVLDGGLDELNQDIFFLISPNIKLNSRRKC